MSWRTLPPAGNPIVFAKGSDSDMVPPSFDSYRSVWVNSGTAALALSLIAARRFHSAIENPEVVLPAYACPDLIAAAVFAGVRPVLADIGADDPGYDLVSLQAALSPKTVAVVAVNFLGIKERLSQLRELLATWPSVLLIEDDAQWFPEPYPNAELQGDIVCLSFGRGKPVSLLGGGVMLINEKLDLPDTTDVVQPAGNLSFMHTIKISIYNLLLSPWVYGLIAKLPFLKIGVTTLKTLQSITAMEPLRLAMLSANLQRYLQRRQIDSLGELDAASVVDLPKSCGERSGQLLRYPVLFVDRKTRDMRWQQLQSAGLGATAMYQFVLPDIPGVSELVTVRGTLTGARQFADRLLTLPVHGGVTERDLKVIDKLLVNVD